MNLKEFLNLTYYTSKLDEFLKNFDKKHPKLSASQQAEIKKSERIAFLRDNPEPTEPKTSLWDKF